MSGRSTNEIRELEGLPNKTEEKVEQVNQTAPFFTVPSDIFSQIIFYLKPVDVGRLMAVSKQTRNMVKDKKTMMKYIFSEVKKYWKEDELEQISKDETYNSMKKLLFVFSKTFNCENVATRAFGHTAAFFDCFFARHVIFTEMRYEICFTYEVFKSIFDSKMSNDEKSAFVIRMISPSNISYAEAVQRNRGNVLTGERKPYDETQCIINDTLCQGTVLLAAAYADYRGVVIGNKETEELLIECTKYLNKYRKYKNKKEKEFSRDGFTKPLNALFKHRLHTHTLNFGYGPVESIVEQIRVYNKFTNRVFKRLNPYFDRENGAKRVKLQRKFKYFSDSLTKNFINIVSIDKELGEGDHINGHLDFFRYIVDASGMFTASFNKFKSAPSLIKFYFKELLPRLDEVISGSYYNVLCNDVVDFTKVFLKHYKNRYDEKKKDEIEGILKCIEILNSDKHEGKKVRVAIERMKGYARILATFFK